MINDPIKSYGSDDKELKYHRSTIPEISFIVIDRVKCLRVSWILNFMFQLKSSYIKHIGIFLQIYIFIHLFV